LSRPSPANSPFKINILLLVHNRLTGNRKELSWKYKGPITGFYSGNLLTFTCVLLLYVRIYAPPARKFSLVTYTRSCHNTVSQVSFLSSTSGNWPEKASILLLYVKIYAPPTRKFSLVTYTRSCHNTGFFFVINKWQEKACILVRICVLLLYVKIYAALQQENRPI
jgi:hypothetical protein